MYPLFSSYDIAMKLRIKKKEKVFNIDSNIKISGYYIETKIFVNRTFLFWKKNSRVRSYYFTVLRHSCGLSYTYENESLG